jgi:hypothetical protein
MTKNAIISTPPFDRDPTIRRALVVLAELATKLGEDPACRQARPRPAVGCPAVTQRSPLVRFGETMQSGKRR